MPICLVASAKTIVIAAELITLVWSHSVQKTEWRETYAVRAAATGQPAALVLVEASVEGSGAGMEAGEGARLVGGRWVWRPGAPALPSLDLARSGETADWTICAGGACRPIATMLGDAGVGDVALRACDPSEPR